MISPDSSVTIGQYMIYLHQRMTQSDSVCKKTVDASSSTSAREAHPTRLEICFSRQLRRLP